MTLDADYSAFVQSGVVIDVAGRDAHNVPVLARGLACRVSADCRRVTLFLHRSHGARCLRAVAATGAVAAVFCHVTTLRTVQLKGSDAEVVPVTPDDLSHVRAVHAAYLADVVALGFAEELGHGEIRHEPHDVVGLAFTLAAAYSQTPGPAAGQRIDAR